MTLSKENLEKLTKFSLQKARKLEGQKKSTHQTRVDVNDWRTVALRGYDKLKKGEGK